MAQSPVPKNQIPPYGHEIIPTFVQIEPLFRSSWVLWWSPLCEIEPLYSPVNQAVRARQAEKRFEIAFPVHTKDVFYVHTTQSFTPQSVTDQGTLEPEAFEFWLQFLQFARWFCCDVLKTYSRPCPNMRLSGNYQMGEQKGQTSLRNSDCDA